MKKKKMLARQHKGRAHRDRQKANIFSSEHHSSSMRSIFEFVFSFFSVVLEDFFLAVNTASRYSSPQVQNDIFQIFQKIFLALNESILLLTEVMNGIFSDWENISTMTTFPECSVQHSRNFSFEVSTLVNALCALCKQDFDAS